MSEARQQDIDALKWLYEMEAVDSPVLRANLYENIFMADKSIDDCAVWVTPSFTYQKGVLVWIKLTRWGKWFKKKEVAARIKSIVNELLPSYDVRIVEDRNILELAQKKVEEVYGGKNESVDTTDSDASDVTGTESGGEDSKLPEASDLLSDNEEREVGENENQTSVRDEIE